MDGVRKCREFIESLDLKDLKAIRLTIKQRNVPKPEFPQPIYRGLDNPRDLVIHFKKEAVSGIFDRKDIVLNAIFPDEKQIRKRCSRSSSETSEDGEKDNLKHKTYRNQDKYKRLNFQYCSSESSEDDGKRDNLKHRKHRNEDKYKRLNSQYSSSESSEDEGKRDNLKHRDHSEEDKNKRSRSKSRKDSPYSRRKKSSSISPRKRSYSPRRDMPRRKSRSTSPKPVKIPGLYIPPKSDYLRYGKRRKSRSPSPTVSHRSPRHYQSNDRKRSRSPRNFGSSKKVEKRRSRSISQDRRERGRSRSPGKREERRRLKSRSPRDRSRRSKSLQRRSRSPGRRSRSTGRRSRSPGRRSRSPGRRNKFPRERRYTSPSRSSRHKSYRQDMENETHMVPYVIPDGEYWMGPGIFPPAGYIPRGYMPPIMYPRGYPAPMLMPRMPMHFMPRPRMFGPRIQSSTITSNRYQNADDDRTQDLVEPENGARDDSSKETGVKISEIVDDSANKKGKDS